jgi:hypothetical protein
MAYCRLGHIKENKKGGGASKGLRDCLAYIFNSQKTNNLEYVGSYNYTIDGAVPPESSYDTMLSTKEIFGKEYGRQGYHYKLSFPSGDDVSPELALKITNEFCERVFTNYECAYAVHTNTEHIHAHIVFNSVDMISGYKYRYEKGDWAKYIMPVANEICLKYGISALDLSLDEKLRLKNKCMDYGKWSKSNNKPKYLGRSYTNAMIKADVDECIHKAADYEEFKRLLTEMGHKVNDGGKHITVLAPGRERPCRLYNLTSDKATYTRENIKKMIDGTYMSRNELMERLFMDWNKYSVDKTRIRVGRLSKDMARFSETRQFVNEKSLWTMQDIDEYRDYINRADRELNIIRKYVTRSLDAKKDMLENVNVIMECMEGYTRYTRQGDGSCRTEYNKVVAAFNGINAAGYSLTGLYRFQKSGELLLDSIKEYKKHIFVEGKICDRLERNYKTHTNQSKHI